jgi:ferritin-like protein
MGAVYSYYPCELEESGDLTIICFGKESLPRYRQETHKVQVRNVLVEAERCAVREYTEISYLDHQAYDLAQSILNEEIEHESWFSEFLGEGPAGQFLRCGDGPPFVSKLLQ